MVWVLEKVYNEDASEVMAVYNDFDLEDATIEAKKDLGVLVKETIMSWKETYSGRKKLKGKVMEAAEAEVLGCVRLHGMECNPLLCENCKGVLLGVDFEDELYYDKKCEVDDEDRVDSESWFNFISYADGKYFFSPGLLRIHLHGYEYYESDQVKIKEV